MLNKDIQLSLIIVGQSVRLPTDRVVPVMSSAAPDPTVVALQSRGAIDLNDGADVDTSLPCHGNGDIEGDGHGQGYEGTEDQEEEEYVEVADEEDCTRTHHGEEDWSSTTSTSTLSSTMSASISGRPIGDPMLHAVHSLQSGVDCLQLLSVILIAFAAMTLFMQLT